MFLFKSLIFTGFASIYTVISLRFRNYFFAFLSLVIHCFFTVVQLLIGITKYPERDALKVLLKVIEPLGKEIQMCWIYLEITDVQDFNGNDNANK